MLNLIDEDIGECLMVPYERHWSNAKVIEALADVMVVKGVPERLRSDSGPDFVAASRFPKTFPTTAPSIRI